MQKVKNKGKLLLVESSVAVLYGIKFLLKKSGIKDIEVATSLNETGLILKQCIYRLVIIGLSLTTDEEMKQFQNIFQNHPHTAFVFFADAIGPKTERELYKMGVQLVIYKTAPVEEFVQSIIQVWEGATDNKNLFTKTLYEQVNFFDQLSQREKDVATCFLQGKTNKEICAELSLKQSTVSTLKNRIFDKLQIQTLSDLIKMKGWSE